MERPDRPPRGGRGAWIAAAAVLVFAGIAVPYGPLAGAPGLGVAVFWLGFGVAVVALILVGVLGWRD